MLTLSRFIAAISLLIALALGVAWVRSFWRNDSLFVERGPRGFFVSSARGWFGIISMPGLWHPRRYHFATYDLSTSSSVLANRIGREESDNLWVIIYGSGKGTYSGREWWLAVPYVIPSIAFAIPPAAMFAAAWRRRRRHRRGLCRACGYNLRASPDRCPECGAPATHPLHSDPA